MFAKDSPLRKYGARGLYVDPAFLLAIYNERVRNRRMQVHPWQRDTLFRFAGHDVDYSTKVNRMNLVASNGSGKSALIVAPSAVWLAMEFPEAHIVVTSASGNQLDRQVGRSINHMCEQVNRIHPEKPWKLNYRNYTYTDTEGRKSIIDMYATDDAGLAEGYHPLTDGGMFAYIADEAKTIPENIFGAIERCNGKSHWMNVSSPGQPLGFFYNAATSERWWTKKVTVYECPHIKEDEIQSAREMYGEHSAIFRSMYLAEFTSVAENVVIPYERILRLYRDMPPRMDDGRRRAGVDLSGGGDENVVSIWQGNEQIALETFQITEARQAVRFLVDIFKKWGLKGENIFVDNGFTGSAIVSSLKDHKYETRAVNFGGKAFNNVAYGNRGTEMWFNFERHLDYLRPMADATQRKQLCSRYYKQSDVNARMVLESKREARANGHGSPDRADATVLAFADLPLGYFNTNAFSAPVEDPLDGTALLRKLIAQNGKMTLTEEQIIAVSDTYRMLRDAQMREREETESGQSVYDVRRMVGASRMRSGLSVDVIDTIGE